VKLAQSLQLGWFRITIEITSTKAILNAECRGSTHLSLRKRTIALTMPMSSANRLTPAGMR
jgi:hypothetical protein